MAATSQPQAETAARLAAADHVVSPASVPPPRVAIPPAAARLPPTSGSSLRRGTGTSSIIRKNKEPKNSKSKAKLFGGGWRSATDAFHQIFLMDNLNVYSVLSFECWCNAVKDGLWMRLMSIYVLTLADGDPRQAGFILTVQGVTRAILGVVAGSVLVDAFGADVVMRFAGWLGVVGILLNVFAFQTFFYNTSANINAVPEQDRSELFIKLLLLNFVWAAFTGISNVGVEVAWARSVVSERRLDANLGRQMLNKSTTALGPLLGIFFLWTLAANKRTGPRQRNDPPPQSSGAEEQWDLPSTTWERRPSESNWYSSWPCWWSELLSWPTDTSAADSVNDVQLPPSSASWTSATQEQGAPWRTPQKLQALEDAGWSLGMLNHVMLVGTALTMMPVLSCFIFDQRHEMRQKIFLREVRKLVFLDPEVVPLTGGPGGSDVHAAADNTTTRVAPGLESEAEDGHDEITRVRGGGGRSPPLQQSDEGGLTQERVVVADENKREQDVAGEQLLLAGDTTPITAPALVSGHSPSKALKKNRLAPLQSSSASIRVLAQQLYSVEPHKRPTGIQLGDFCHKVTLHCDHLNKYSFVAARPGFVRLTYPIRPSSRFASLSVLKKSTLEETDYLIGKSYTATINLLPLFYRRGQVETMGTSNATDAAAAGPDTTGGQDVLVSNITPEQRSIMARFYSWHHQDLLEQKREKIRLAEAADAPDVDHLTAAQVGEDGAATPALFPSVQPAGRTETAVEDGQEQKVDTTGKKLQLVLQVPEIDPLVKVVFKDVSQAPLRATVTNMLIFLDPSKRVDCETSAVVCSLCPDRDERKILQRSSGQLSDLASMRMLFLFVYRIRQRLKGSGTAAGAEESPGEDVVAEDPAAGALSGDGGRVVAAPSLAGDAGRGGFNDEIVIETNGSNKHTEDGSSSFLQNGARPLLSPMMDASNGGPASAGASDDASAQERANASGPRDAMYWVSRLRSYLNSSGLFARSGRGVISPINADHVVPAGLTETSATTSINTTNAPVLRVQQTAAADADDADALSSSSLEGALLFENRAGRPADAVGTLAGSASASSALMQSNSFQAVGAELRNRGISSSGKSSGAQLRRTSFSSSELVRGAYLKKKRQMTSQVDERRQKDRALILRSLEAAAQQEEMLFPNDTLPLRQPGPAPGVDGLDLETDDGEGDVTAAPASVGNNPQEMERQGPVSVPPGGTTRTTTTQNTRRTRGRGDDDRNRFTRQLSVGGENEKSLGQHAPLAIAMRPRAVPVATGARQEQDITGARHMVELVRETGTSTSSGTTRTAAVDLDHLIPRTITAGEDEEDEALAAESGKLQEDDLYSSRDDRGPFDLYSASTRRTSKRKSSRQLLGPPLTVVEKLEHVVEVVQDSDVDGLPVRTTQKEEELSPDANEIESSSGPSKLHAGIMGSSFSSRPAVGFHLLGSEDLSKTTTDEGFTGSGTQLWSSEVHQQPRSYVFDSDYDVSPSIEVAKNAGALEAATSTSTSAHRAAINETMKTRQNTYSMNLPRRSTGISKLDRNIRNQRRKLDSGGLYGDASLTQYQPNLYGANVILFCDLLNALATGFSGKLIPLFLVQEYEFSPFGVLWVAFFSNLFAVFVAPYTKNVIHYTRQRGYPGKVGVLVVWLIGMGFLSVLCVPRSIADLPWQGVAAAVIIRNAVNGSAKSYLRAKLVNYLPYDKVTTYMAWDTLNKAQQGGLVIFGTQLAFYGGYRVCFLTTLLVLAIRWLVFLRFILHSEGAVGDWWRADRAGMTTMPDNEAPRDDGAAPAGVRNRNSDSTQSFNEAAAGAGASGARTISRADAGAGYMPPTIPSRDAGLAEVGVNVSMSNAGRLGGKRDEHVVAKSALGVDHESNQGRGTQTQKQKAQQDQHSLGEPVQHGAPRPPSRAAPVAVPISSRFSKSGVDKKQMVALAEGESGSTAQKSPVTIPFRPPPRRIPTPDNSPALKEEGVTQLLFELDAEEDQHEDEKLTFSKSTRAGEGARNAKELSPRSDEEYVGGPTMKPAAHNVEDDAGFF